MDQGLLPRRYAKALLLFCRERQADARLYGLMQRLEAAFDAEPRLQSTLANPHVEIADKMALIHAAAGTDTEPDDAFADFIKLLADNKRLGSLRDIALAYIA
ncbi:MAG: F0F1 ATP synthase subunit delta, partial [Muribaculaceae bacterium]|nr:F0F1 ATP synthase subunit delta [Muribaculaceae bacterium]